MYLCVHVICISHPACVPVGTNQATMQTCHPMQKHSQEQPRLAAVAAHRGG